MGLYIALVHSAGESNYGISFPDFPGCVSAGDTLEECLREGAEALAFHAEGMREDGEPIPAPRSIDDVRRNPPAWVDFENAILATIPLLPALGRAVRVQITLDERLLSRIDAVTKNRSGFLADAATMVLSQASGSSRSVETIVADLPTGGFQRTVQRNMRET